MRILYIAPRYHTNQAPIIRGWLKRGDQVRFLSQFAGESEDYTDLTPKIVGYSRLTDLLMWLLRWVYHGGKLTQEQEFAVRIKIGVPPFGRMKREIADFSPDLVILRERSIYNISPARFCRKQGIPCILYNQSPLWDLPDRDRGLLRTLLIRALPRQRMTPVMGCREEGKIPMPDATFVPFIAPPVLSPEEKGVCPEGRVKLLCVARYEERKRLHLLIEAAEDLLRDGRAHLTVAGEAADPQQKEYLGRIQKMVQEKNLQDQVTLLQNLSRAQVFALYKEADLFVLPSTRERASVSQLEAMSCSLPVICSDTNGSACYVEHLKSGLLFEDDQKDSLKRALLWMLEDPNRLRQMGRESYHLICTRYQFDNYAQKVLELRRYILDHPE